MGLPFRFTVVGPRHNVVHGPSKSLFKVFLLYSQQSKVVPKEQDERNVSAVLHAGFITLSLSSTGVGVHPLPPRCRKLYGVVIRLRITNFRA
jgi:hypothetical protein